MKKIILCGVAATALVGTSAQAQEGNWYGGLDGYLSFLGQEKSESNTHDIQNRYKTGGGFAGKFGYDFGQIRLEGEIGKHFNSAKEFTIVNDAGLGLSNGSATNGKANVTHYMMNAVLDLDDIVGSDAVEPFIGGGLGVADLALQNLTPAGSTLPYVNGSSTEFAYQAFAGVRVPLSDAVDASLNYRYMGTNDASLVDRLGANFNASYDVHDIVLGISYKFGVKKNDEMAKKPQPISVAQRPVQEAAPVPDPTPVADIAPAAPAPAPVIDKGPYSIYFDWDSSYVSTAAREVIRKAIIESTKAEQITIQVDGYADRSGPTGYNDNLSFERATAVKETLIANGVSADKILIEGYGERMPEVPTDDGVREQKNRRVIIKLK